MELAEKLLVRINISKPRRGFLLTLFTTILVTRGKINFRNLARYSELCEHTYSRNFAKPFDFVSFNRRLIDETFGEESERILAFDPSFIPKAGQHTFGRDFFWNGCANRAQKGLEIASLAVVDIAKNQALNLSARQTLAQERGESAGTEDASDDKAKQSRMQHYLEHIKAVRPYLLDCEHYLTVDGSFANEHFLNSVTALDLEIIGKLRCDANMRYLYKGPKRPGRGRQKSYDGKVDWQELSRFDYVGADENIQLYTGVLNHVQFKRNLRVVVLVKHQESKTPRYILLFSTDEQLDAWKIYL
jgi:hypothetical protein